MTVEIDSDMTSINQVLSIISCQGQSRSPVSQADEPLIIYLSSLDIVHLGLSGIRIELFRIHGKGGMLQEIVVTYGIADKRQTDLPFRSHDDIII